MTAPATLTVFWDYDTQWGAERSRAGFGPRPWGYLEFEHTDRLLDLHAEFAVPACFAVVGAAARTGQRPYHDPAQVRRMHAAGHEVASHGLQHEWLPGLDGQRLRAVLRESKEALEQCIGAEVAAFVPPYNQPFDHWPAGSISLAERREAGRVRTDLRALCRALAEAGYRHCRVAYRSLPLRMCERVLRRRLDRPRQPVVIEQVVCMRLNTPGGFGPDARRVLEQCIARGGHVVVYGHPHSLRSGNLEDERWLRPFLADVVRHREAGRLNVALPRTLGAG